MSVSDKHGLYSNLELGGSQGDCSSRGPFLSRRVDGNEQQSQSLEGLLRQDKMVFFLCLETDLTPQVICPLESTPLVICTGLNYLTHAQEAGVSRNKIPCVEVLDLNIS